MIYSLREVTIDLGDVGEYDGYITGEISKVGLSKEIYCDPNTVRVFIFHNNPAKETDVSHLLTKRARMQRATELEEAYEIEIDSREPDPMGLAKANKEEEMCG